ncbi:DNA polymerase III subunit chi [Candidatus Nesciobacter abundans]|uniref:DNA polymerase III subunit chi n=1 Tax=Candidatus Nesciobacter abundans TaxID=2601668 RepID=A0A5C0UGL2_9PROT|nr:DNA polymerase III subunit chi [Candidatus Nesciobacter abundans]QEK39255.1 hypothetical protein FZC36_02375 [Candidatus Nesciobacter abundans]
MKITSYYTENENDVKYIFSLMHKLYKLGKRIYLKTNNVVEQEVLSELFWKFRTFLPHGTTEDQYQELQPVLVSGMEFEDYIAEKPKAAESNKDCNQEHQAFSTLIIYRHPNQYTESMINKVSGKDISGSLSEVIFWNPDQHKNRMMLVGKVWIQQGINWVELKKAD